MLIHLVGLVESIRCAGCYGCIYVYKAEDISCWSHVVLATLTNCWLLRLSITYMLPWYCIKVMNILHCGSWQLFCFFICRACIVVVTEQLKKDLSTPSIQERVVRWSLPEWTIIQGLNVGTQADDVTPVTASFRKLNVDWRTFSWLLDFAKFTALHYGVSTA